MARPRRPGLANWGEGKQIFAERKKSGERVLIFNFYGNLPILRQYVKVKYDPYKKRGDPVQGL
jgi:hypothetical protein